MDQHSEQHRGIIKLLPSEISNKIAAGEVVQRPSSVVKELLDNAIDSGADTIKIIIQGAGKTLIQVVDNGCGIAREDIPNCFLRHATSKISRIEDLYRIMTLGFRGEAMASIASVAQVTLTSKRFEDENGWETEIWGGDQRRLEPAATDNGTSVAVRNLFFNVPARRAFLKTDATEFRHILLTVQQAALANTGISFELISDGEVVYKLPVQRLSERIPELFGKSYKASLIPLEEKTTMFSVRGFIIDPKFSKKTRGEQFLFVNGRPFMHRHLSYVIQDIYKDWLRPNEYPFYALFYDIEPELVDVNVHPSKLEVKFEDERGVSTLTRSIVKKALYEHLRVPDIEATEHFESFDTLAFSGSGSHFERGAWRDEKDSGMPSSFSSQRFRSDSSKNWSSALYETKGFTKDSNSERSSEFPTQQAEISPVTGSFQKPVKHAAEQSYWQLHNQFIVSQTLTGVCLVDQHAAHKRIIYERSLQAFDSGIPSSQQLLFPHTIEFSATDFELLKDLLDDIAKMGFHIQVLSGNTAMVSGVPADIQAGHEKDVLESILRQYQALSGKMKLSSREKLAVAFATRTAIPKGKRLTQIEMDAIMDQLFSCSEPYSDPTGKPTIRYMSLDEIRQKFQ